MSDYLECNVGDEVMQDPDLYGPNSPYRGRVYTVLKRKGAVVWFMKDGKKDYFSAYGIILVRTADEVRTDKITKLLG